MLLPLVKIDSRSVELVMFQSNYLFCFVNLLRREITKYLLKSAAEEKRKMAQLYQVFIM